MLDPSLLRQDPAALAERLRATRGFALDAAAVERLEPARKRIQVPTQELQNLRNTRGKAHGTAKETGADAPAQTVRPPERPGEKEWVKTIAYRCSRDS